MSHISPQTLQRLHRLARPFEPLDEFLNRIAERLEAEQVGATEDKPTGGQKETSESRRFDPFDPPNLTHTKVMSASVNGQEISPKWNALLDSVLATARNKLPSFDALRKICPANIVSGRKESEGYRYLDKVDFSVQGQDAIGAWKAAAFVAQRLGIRLEVVFVWRNKAEAAFPGETGSFSL